MPTHTKFKGVSEFGNTEISSQIRDNIKAFFDWGFLEIGAFANVRMISSGLYGGTYDKLIHNADRRHSTGKIWQGARKDWVWETGIEYGTMKPIQISGVYVNNTFHPSSGTDAYAHIVDYPNGRVIFNTAIATTSTVQCEYSYRRVQIVDADTDFFKQIQQNSYRVDNNNFLLNSGDWQQLPNNRLQLPTIALEVVPRRVLYGYQLGGGHGMRQDVNFYIISDNSEDRNRIQDILSKQKDKTFFMFDMNKMANDRTFPLTISGSINPSGNLAYSHNVRPSGDGGYQWKKMFIPETNIQNIGQINPGLYGGIVQMTFELYMPEI